jgi:transglutaminase-like putative cysteine protease
MSEPRRYHVRHETVYYYGGDVAHSHQLLHLAPRSAPHQICLSHALTLDPSPSGRRDDDDAFGNPVTRLEYDRPHDRLEVLSDLRVEMRSVPPAAPEQSLAWEEVSRQLGFPVNAATPESLEACRFRMESGYVRVKHAFTDYAAECFAPERPVLAAALDLTQRIHRDFAYAPGSTDIKTSALEAFKARRGVCQDFAHIMIACLRAHGLAARYVSGYLRTAPLRPAAPSQSQSQGAVSDAPIVGAVAPLVGADASHAWVSVYCPPLGWIDLDPTNDCRVGVDHVTIAWGRDFGDVSPLRGVIIGGARHRLSVRVSVQPE